MARYMNHTYRGVYISTLFKYHTFYQQSFPHAYLLMRIRIRYTVRVELLLSNNFHLLLYGNKSTETELRWAYTLTQERQTAFQNDCKSPLGKVPETKRSMGKNPKKGRQIRFVGTPAELMQFLQDLDQKQKNPLSEIFLENLSSNTIIPDGNR